VREYPDYWYELQTDAAGDCPECGGDMTYIEGTIYAELRYCIKCGYTEIEYENHNF